MAAKFSEVEDQLPAPKQATQIKSLAEQVTDELTCAICFSRFDNPKVLPCLHLYCEKCLGAMVDKARDKTKLSCPQCQEVHQVPANGVSGFKTYFTINNLLELLQIHEMTEKPGEHLLKCESGLDQNPAAAYCPSCSEYLCADCLSLHKRMKRTSSHKSLSLEEIKHSDRKAGVKSISKKKYCPEHDDEFLKLFCKTCKEAICRDCALVKHQSHEYVFVRDLRPEVQKELEMLIKLVKGREVEFNEQTKTVQKILLQNASTLKSCEKVINDHCQELIDAVEARRAKLLAELHETHEREDKILTAENEYVSMALVRLTNGIRFTQQLLENGDDLDVVTMSTQATDTLEGLNKMSVDKSLGAVVLQASFELNEPKSAVTQFGTVDFGVLPCAGDIEVKLPTNPGKGEMVKFYIECSKRLIDKCSNIMKLVAVKVSKDSKWIDVKTISTNKHEFTASCVPHEEGEYMVSILFGSIKIKEHTFLCKPRSYEFMDIEGLSDCEPIQIQPLEVEPEEIRSSSPILEVEPESSSPILEVEPEPSSPILEVEPESSSPILEVEPESSSPILEVESEEIHSSSPILEVENTNWFHTARSLLSSRPPILAPRPQAEQRARIRQVGTGKKKVKKSNFHY